MDFPFLESVHQSECDMKIAYQGEVGAFSEEAAKRLYPSCNPYGVPFSLLQPEFMLFPKNPNDVFLCQLVCHIRILCAFAKYSAERTV